MNGLQSASDLLFLPNNLCSLAMRHTLLATLNSKRFHNRRFSRQDAFEKYDKPCMKPLPGGEFTVCDCKSVNKIPNNYHIEYDGHYYSVVYTYCGKPAILKNLLITGGAGAGKTHIANALCITALHQLHMAMLNSRFCVAKRLKCEAKRSMTD